MAAASVAACTAESGEDTGASASAFTPTASDFPHVKAPKQVNADLQNLPGDLRAQSVPGFKAAEIAPYVKDKPAAIRLGKALGLQVTAEGVETEAQRAELIAGGCTLLQGHLGGRATDATAIDALVKQETAASHAA